MSCLCSFYEMVHVQGRRKDSFHRITFLQRRVLAPRLQRKFTKPSQRHHSSKVRLQAALQRLHVAPLLQNDFKLALEHPTQHRLRQTLLFQIKIRNFRRLL